MIPFMSDKSDRVFKTREIVVRLVRGIFFAGMLEFKSSKRGSVGRIPSEHVEILCVLGSNSVKNTEILEQIYKLVHAWIAKPILKFSIYRPATIQRESTHHGYSI